MSDHTATHCNALQHTATHCNTLQRTATHCNALQHTATHCNTLLMISWCYQHTRNIVSLILQTLFVCALCVIIAHIRKESYMRGHESYCAVLFEVCCTYEGCLLVHVKESCRTCKCESNICMGFKTYKCCLEHINVEHVRVKHITAEHIKTIRMFAYGKEP